MTPYVIICWSAVPDKAAPSGKISNTSLSRPPLDRAKQESDPRYPWHEAPALVELFDPHERSVELSERTISFTGTSAREWVESESRDHPMANEDPDGFRLTSPYAVAEITPQ